MDFMGSVVARLGGVVASRLLPARFKTRPAWLASRRYAFWLTS
jgi:hypothetical protein